jgi:hypothetical protein
MPGVVGDRFDIRGDIPDLKSELIDIEIDGRLYVCHDKTGRNIAQVWHIQLFLALRIVALLTKIGRIVR